jgi:hypothetical protein
VMFFMKRLNPLILIFLTFTAPALALAQHQVAEQWEDRTAFGSPLELDYTLYSREQVTTAKAKWKELGQILKKPKAYRWAGEYGLDGEPFWTYLRWSPQAGFVMLGVYTCHSQLKGLSYGRVIVERGYIQFIPDGSLEINPDRERPTYKLPTKYVPVTWGKSSLLAGEKTLAAFCRDAAGLQEDDSDKEQNYAVFFIKRGDEIKPRGGTPNVPAKYRHLIQRPINAKIIAIGETKLIQTDNPWWNDRVTSVVINAGEAVGIKKGMWLGIRDSSRREAVEVTEVDERTAQGVIVRTVRKPGVKFEAGRKSDPVYPQIKVGWRLSTRTD